MPSRAEIDDGQSGLAYGYDTKWRSKNFTAEIIRPAMPQGRER